MIESVSLKKLIFLTLFLIVTCVVILTLEGILIESSSNHTVPHKPERGCWDTEEFFIKHECTPCSDFDKKSQHIEACNKSSYKELVSCSKSGEVYRTCSDSSTLHFYKFELITWMLGGLSSLFVVYRKRVLDKRMLQRIQAQVAAGV